MFAVPGWNLPIKSPVQQLSKSAKQNTSTNQPPTKKVKDAKRGSGESQQDNHKYSRSVTTRKEHVKSSGGGRRLVTDGKVGDIRKHEKTQKTADGVKDNSSKYVNDTQAIPGKKRKRGHEDEKPTSYTVPAALASLPPPLLPATNLTPLQAKMRSKLTSARFRHLNETLYTTDSSSALNLFTTSPDLFAEYHAGFAQQVKDSWPQNPVDNYISAIKTRGALSQPGSGQIPLPRRKTGSCTVADLGCGDAPLARGCQTHIKSLQLKFHNYDLHAPNTHVTKADIANLPLRDGEADIVVFCLSLMGTNWLNFVEEAWRVLRGDGKGEVWVAEVKSRFGRPTKGRVVENSVGKRRKNPRSSGDDGYNEPEQFVDDAHSAEQSADETDVSAFVKVFSRRGFQLKPESVTKNNKMFVSMIFVKSGIPSAGKHKGMKWTGREYQRQEERVKPTDSRFPSARSRDDEEPTPEEEAKVLKPCVYKTR